MSQLATGIFGAIAVSLTFGAVQLASGRDLAGTRQESFQDRFQDRFQNSLGTSDAAVNRAAKADRAQGVAGSPPQTRTISLRLDGLSDTSILVRIPVAREARNSAPASMMTRPGDRKVTIACDPVVSVLTEVAKQLQPGRCVT